MNSNYTVRRPITSGQSLRADPIVSRHRTLAGACASLRRQREGAREQGGYSRDYIACRTHPITDAEADALIARGHAAARRMPKGGRP